MALFRVDFSGRGELAERQQKLGQMMSRLQKIAEEFNVAVFVTNHVCSDPSGGLTFVQDPKKVRHLPPFVCRPLLAFPTHCFFVRRCRGCTSSARSVSTQGVHVGVETRRESQPLLPSPTHSPVHAESTAASLALQPATLNGSNDALLAYTAHDAWF
jgi:hypothetical protein